MKYFALVGTIILGMFIGKAVQFLAAMYVLIGDRDDESNDNRKKIFIDVFKCSECGHKLEPVSYIPIVGALINKGKCPKCNTKLYSLSFCTEMLAVLCVFVVYLTKGICVESCIYFILTFILIIITYVDLNIYIIPPSLNIAIAILGVAMCLYDYSNIAEHIIGLLAISIPLYILIVATDGRAMGGGDLKLMAACGLLLGWKCIVLAFFLGCIFGSVIHVIRMKVSNESHRLALGPYLALGIFVSMLWGMDMISWYLSLI